MSNAQLQSLSQHAKQRLDRKKTAKLERKEKLESVSYTHLTLPTIYSV